MLPPAAALLSQIRLCVLCILTSMSPHFVFFCEIWPILYQAKRSLNAIVQFCPLITYGLDGLGAVWLYLKHPYNAIINGEKHTQEPRNGLNPSPHGKCLLLHDFLFGFPQEGHHCDATISRSCHIKIQTTRDLKLKHKKMGDHDHQAVMCGELEIEVTIFIFINLMTIFKTINLLNMLKAINLMQYLKP